MNSGGRFLSDHLAKVYFSLTHTGRKRVHPEFISAKFAPIRAICPLTIEPDEPLIYVAVLLSVRIREALACPARIPTANFLVRRRYNRLVRRFGLVPDPIQVRERRTKIRNKTFMVPPEKNVYLAASQTSLCPDVFEQLPQKVKITIWFALVFAHPFAIYRIRKYQQCRTGQSPLIFTSKRGVRIKPVLMQDDKNSRCCIIVRISGVIY